MPEEEQLRLIERFYIALQQRDAAAMAACYHKQVHFTDPVFDLRGRAAGEMWRMLCAKGRDLKVAHGKVRVDGSRVRAHWEARYTFSGTGRRVHNVIEAEFEFEGGLIVRHVDRFGFWRWSRQALGLVGWLFGWTGLLRAKVRHRAARSLAEFCGDTDQTVSRSPRGRG
jgi:hypothetical protein